MKLEDTYQLPEYRPMRISQENVEWLATVLGRPQRSPSWARRYVKKVITEVKRRIEHESNQR